MICASSAGAASGRYQSKQHRAMILLASSTDMEVPQIASLVCSDESHVRKVIARV